MSVTTDTVFIFVFFVLAILDPFIADIVNRKNWRLIFATLSILCFIGILQLPSYLIHQWKSLSEGPVRVIYGCVVAGMAVLLLVAIRAYLVDLLFGERTYRGRYKLKELRIGFRANRYLVCFQDNKSHNVNVRVNSATFRKLSRDSDTLSSGSNGHGNEVKISYLPTSKLALFVEVIS